MNKIFDNTDEKGKLIILTFLKEEGISINIKFTEAGYEYFADNLPKLYKDILLGGDNIIHFLGRIDSIGDDKEIKVTKMVYFTGDAKTTFDSSYITKFTCPLYPNGVCFNIPLKYIKTASAFGRISN